MKLDKLTPAILEQVYATSVVQREMRRLDRLTTQHPDGISLDEYRELLDAMTKVPRDFALSEPITTFAKRHKDNLQSLWTDLEELDHQMQDRDMLTQPGANEVPEQLSEAWDAFYDTGSSSDRLKRYEERIRELEGQLYLEKHEHLHTRLAAEQARDLAADSPVFVPVAVGNKPEDGAGVQGSFPEAMFKRMNAPEVDAYREDHEVEMVLTIHVTATEYVASRALDLCIAVIESDGLEHCEFEGAFINPAGDELAV